MTPDERQTYGYWAGIMAATKLLSEIKPDKQDIVLPVILKVATKRVYETPGSPAEDILLEMQPVLDKLKDFIDALDDSLL